MKHKKNQSGFTLIELLVVIAIIGLLASIVITSFSVVRKKARDVRRVTDLRQINTAIQFYLNETGHAPYVGSFDCQASNAGSQCDVTEVQTAEWSALQSELSPYLPKLPTDPCGISCYDSGKGQHGYFAYVYISPAAIARWCDCTSTNSQYAIFAEQMEVASNIWNITFKGIPTFGFVNHGMGSSF